MNSRINRISIINQVSHLNKDKSNTISLMLMMRHRSSLQEDIMQYLNRNIPKIPLHYNKVDAPSIGLFFSLEFLQLVFLLDFSTEIIF